MLSCLLGLALALVAPSCTAVIAAPRLTGSLGDAGSVPMIAMTSPSRAFSGTSLPAPLSPSMPTRGEAQRPLPPATAAAVPTLAILAAPAAADGTLFDGGRAAAPGTGWTIGAFEGDGGARIRYKTRDRTGGAPTRVYAGGLALTESFEPLFARAEKPAGGELFLWPRGHAPSTWRPTNTPIDADARDLARAVVIAAKTSPGGKVELVLHSFATLVFQRMVQLHAEPAVAAALKALAGSRVFLLNATTHYQGSEKRAGPDFERMGRGARGFIDWLNAADETAELWKAAARLNPFLTPVISAWVELWRLQRERLIAFAARDASAMMRADLAEPWDKDVDHIRRVFIKNLERNARDPGWQEALLRRSSDMFRLEFTRKDAARIKKLGVGLELVHAENDKLLNWESAKVLFERLGIDAPETTPPAGSALTDRTGRLRARIVAGDHYFPLKRRDELAALLAP